MTERERIPDGEALLPEGWTIGPERGSIDFPEHYNPGIPDRWGVTDPERRRPWHEHPVVAEMLAEANLSITVDNSYRLNGTP